MAFLSHCGVGSILEAVYYGVPIVAVGIFADQIDNAAMIEDRGLGVRLFKSQLSEDNVFKALNTVLYNSRQEL